MDFKLDAQELEFLKTIGISIFDEKRNYWFVRTQGGDYYNDFDNENFIGIEWDEISNIDFIKNSSETDLKTEVVKFYPNVEKPGTIVSKILMFVKDMKKGDIVLIPSKNSDWISFGEILDDEITIYEEDEEDDFQILLDEFYDNSDNKKRKSILKKRRNVRWISKFKRKHLDPGLQGVIYNPSAIFGINTYSLFIDRTLSQFYIKGEEAYFTYKVNKKKNIPYSDMLKFLNDNDNLINYINKYAPVLTVDSEKLVLKINVQSKGPVSLKGAVRDVLIVGLTIAAIFGANIKFKIPGMEYNIETNGLAGLLVNINNLIENKELKDRNKELEEIIQGFKEDKEKLELKVPTEESENISPLKKDIEVVITK